MKIGLYGVSRSGKNYLINRVSKQTAGIKYMPGSITLKALAAKIFNTDFKSLSDAQKNHLRIAFTKEVRKEEKRGSHIIVDGHYSFPLKDGSGYNVVFTESDMNLYDVFIYMNTPSDRIAANAALGEMGRENTLYDITAIDKWKEYEIAALRKICRQLGKELIVFDGEMDSSCDFLCDLVTNSAHLLASNIVKNIIDDHQSILSSYDTVLLVDCDRTLTLNDTTYDFCKMAEIDKSILKTIYNGEYYSVYQFYRASKRYDAVIPDSLFYAACECAAQKALFNERLLADIRSRLDNVCVIGITSGIANIWSEIQHKIGFPQILIGKGRGKMNGYFISTTTKYMLAAKLQEMGKKVIAVGDSMIDIQMLETANKGYIITGEKINSGVKTYFETVGKNTKIKQLAYNLFKYDNIAEVVSIW